jgi:hypothetical protein
VLDAKAREAVQAYRDARGPSDVRAKLFDSVGRPGGAS